MLKLGTAQVIRANSRHLPLADNSVDLVVTSPPYFALRSYQDGGEHYAGQIGDEPTPAEFVASLLEVTAECVRVLKPSGSLWVNLGDKYAGAPSGPRQGMPDGATRKAESHIFQTRRKVTPAAPNKSLIGIPWRYALRCIDDLGLILRAEVIWSKPNGLPESVTDRVRRSHEQWFHFTLNPRYYSAVDEIREPHLEPDRKRADVFGGVTGTNGVRHAGASTYTGPTNPLGKLPGSVWTVPTEPLRVPDHLGIDHFAAFPTEWPKRIIAGWSPSGVCVECEEGRRPVTIAGDYEQAGHGGNYAATEYGAGNHGTQGSTLRTISTKTITGYSCDCPIHEPAVGRDTPACKCGRTFKSWRAQGVHETAERKKGAAPTTPAVVLDPFGGTGTTAMVAKALGRHGISVDMSADYCRLAQWRTNDRNQLAKVLGIEKAEQQDANQLDLFEETA
jgi:DNA modification methylase